MNKKPLFAGLSALAICALAVPLTVSALKKAPVKYLTTDPIEYDSKEDSIVKYEDMAVVPSRDAEYELPRKVELTYINDDGRCNSRRFYTWVDELDGVEQTSATSEANQMSLILDFDNDPKFAQYGGKETLWLIIKFGGTWAGQSEDTKIKYADYLDFYKDTGVLKLWIIPAEGTSLEICTSYEDTQITKVSTAKFVANNGEWKTIHCVSSDPDSHPVWVKLYCFDRVYLTSDVASQTANKELYCLKELNNITTGEFDITLKHTAHINLQYVVESVYPGFESKPARKCYVSFENLYSTPRFSEHYTYSGNDLGVTYAPERTTFKVWSPISACIDLRLYDEGVPASMGGDDSGRTTQMFYTGHGVWEVTIEGDLLQKSNRFYNYIVTNPAGSSMEVVDPYAHAVGYNGLRGYVYDSSETNPSGWADIPQVWDGKTGYDIKNPQDLSIYEVHVRDLTMDETWVGNSKRGTYEAFAESGTRYSKEIGGRNYTVKTGFDHIEELGVKAVQLLPVFDSDNEENYEKYKFNWGYNPLNYNCVEGAYSSDPTDPLARIREYKSLIMKYANNANHTRIIMDVVYNHVNSAPNSCFTKLMPKYYFRYTADWSYTNGSGCSNDVRTEAPMMRKYIVDSLKWWATEYKIKGFRFDLMGLIDVETMRQVRNALTEIDPDIYIYGEGWTSGGTNFDAGAEGADTANVYSKLWNGSTNNVNGYVGAFNDEARNNIRGNNDSGWAAKGNKYPTWGFVSNGKNDGAGNIGVLFDMIKGYHTGKGGNPNQMIAYASCHDNYTVWDQLRYCLATNGYSSSDEMGSGFEYEKPLRPKANGEPAISDLVAGSIMAHGMVMASNGVAFMQGGEEIYRTKTIIKEANAEQGLKATPEYDKLMEGGAEATIRPFPSYMNYNPKNNPEDPEYDASAPISVLCTGEVKMFGSTEMVSHNSYKLPDSVNSFKWDRKICIGSTMTYDNFEAWKSMVSLRHSTEKYDYYQMDPGNESNPNRYDIRFSMWGNDNFGGEYGAGGLGIYIPNGIHIALSSRDGGYLSVGEQSFRYYSRAYKSYTGGNLDMKAYSIFVWKL